MQYFKLWFKTAISNSLNQSDFWSSITGSVIAIVCHYLPKGEKLMEPLIWQIPLWSLATTMAIRLIMAPYWIWKKDQEKLGKNRISQIPSIQKIIVEHKESSSHDIFAKMKEKAKKWEEEQEDPLICYKIFLRDKADRMQEKIITFNSNTNKTTETTIDFFEEFLDWRNKAGKGIKNAEGETEEKEFIFLGPSYSSMPPDPISSIYLKQHEMIGLASHYCLVLRKKAQDVIKTRDGFKCFHLKEFKDK